MVPTGRYTSSGRKEIDSEFFRRAFRVNAAVVVTFERQAIGSSMMPNSVTHFEICAANPAGLADFYRSAFGWQVEQMPGMTFNLGVPILDEELERK